MFSVEVRDRIMIAHSLPDPFFGPAQNMHGATFVVDVAFYREEMTKQNVVVDIGAALDVLNKTLKPSPTRTSILSRSSGACSPPPSSSASTSSTRSPKAARDGALGGDGRGLARIRVTLARDGPRPRRL